MTKKMVENVKMPIITVHSNDIMNLFSNEFAIWIDSNKIRVTTTATTRLKKTKYTEKDEKQNNNINEMKKK